MIIVIILKQINYNIKHIQMEILHFYKHKIVQKKINFFLDYT